ncbi:PREDICTED: alpha-tocopherol transfer protein-like isoform X2 [Nicrophorus vespilloides]|uniref:Alpha-tocopherol transfer protein-like isoform X2 n=1 Tax=Nicrophorus vespilloides TaxID=110193 RepID=A0ABM1NJ76_NICVS|nr:PREDICTED: alpha-tocopherol transfer protein-like isoform X2 [Nicrophorus vespilloides]
MKEDQQCAEYVKAMQVWLRKQPHLPQNIDESVLARFIQCSEMSLEKCKSLLDLNYTLRSQAPEIFDKRDPEDRAIQNMFDIIDFCPLPKLTDKKYKLFIYRLTDSDVEKFLFADSLKAFFMVADMRMYSDREYSEGEIPIFDMGHLTLRHMTKITLPLLKKYMVFTQEAHPVRLRQIHVLNIVPFFDKCLALVKPFMKAEVSQLLHFHLPNSTTLFDHIPRDLIPEEFGGSLPVTMKSLKEEWRQRVCENRDFYMDPSKWKVDERLRPQSNKNGDGNLFGMQGSFRVLTID